MHKAQRPSYGHWALQKKHMWEKCLLCQQLSACITPHTVEDSGQDERSHIFILPRLKISKQYIH